MKTIKLFLVITLLIITGTAISAQATTKASSQQKTESFKVLGNCDMCKARIEKAVKAEGATSADWDKTTKILTVTFNPAKTSVDAFSKKLASVGHDTEKYKTTGEVYANLPGCCQYERAK